MKDRHFDILYTLFEGSKNVEPVAQSRIMAAVFYKNKLISLGFNQKKTDPFQKEFSHHPEAINMHAEVHAIKQAKKKLSPAMLAKCTIYVARSMINQTQKKGGKPVQHFSFGLAKPCEGCTRCIKKHGIKKVVYTTYEGYSVDFLS